MISYILVFMLVNATWLRNDKKWRLDFGRESDGKLPLGMFTKPDEQDVASGSFNAMVNNFFCMLNLIRSLRRLSASVRAHLNTHTHNHYMYMYIHICTYI